jgi:hypothetical protein
MPPSLRLGLAASELTFSVSKPSAQLIDRLAAAPEPCE